MTITASGNSYLHSGSALLRHWKSTQWLWLRPARNGWELSFSIIINEEVARRSSKVKEGDFEAGVNTNDTKLMIENPITISGCLFIPSYL